MKKTVLMLVLGICLICFAGCGSEAEFADQATEASENSQQSIIDEEPVEVEEELPDSLYFIKHLDPVKNNNGTYSFFGYFTGTTPSGSLNITGTNGGGISMGTTIPALRSFYVSNSGEYRTVAADVVFHFYEINGILFEFVYDTDGTLVELNQVE